MQLVNGLHLRNIRGDIYGGLTAAVVALPLAMAMGVASGVGPIAGLYGAICVGFFAALLGGTPAQVSGPTGPMTVVMAAVFTQYTTMFPNDPGHGAAIAFTVVVLGGLIQILFGILRLGKYIELVPHPVISGFMSGIGVIIILLQIGPLMGQEAISEPLAAILAIPGVVGHLEYHSFEIGMAVLAMVYGIPLLLPGLNRLIPAPLFALIAGTLFYVLFMEYEIPVIGDIPAGFPSPHLPVFDASLALKMLTSGLMLACLGAIDSLLTSLVADNITRTQHKPDRELIGQGIGNSIAGLFGGLPGAGATMRTVVNVKAGGRTPISGTLHAIILLAIVLGAGPLASEIPRAVLAGILIKVGTDIIDWDYLKRISIAPKAGVVVMFTVFAVTITIDLLLAVGIGMVMASFLFMKRMTDMQISNIRPITHIDEEMPLQAEERAIMKEADGKILLFHLSGPMSFSSAKAMVRRHADIVGYQVMLLDMTTVPVIDFTTARAIEDIVLDTKSAGRHIFLVGVRPAVSGMLEKQQILRHFNTEHMYPSRLDALLDAKKILEQAG
ncbi:MAG: SulP family inorganic anion transporter [Proteobacteria bacterium]|nr:SulP family inorganic anion transporter [Pseudomonadota bacterium]